MTPSDHIMAVLCRHSPAMRMGGAVTPVDEGTRLFEGGLDFDSVSFLAAVLAIESELGVNLRDESLTADSVVTIGSFAEYVLRESV